MNTEFEGLNRLLDIASDEAVQMLALLTDEQQALQARAIDAMEALAARKQPLSEALQLREQGLAHWMAQIESRPEADGLSARAVIRRDAPALEARLAVFLETLGQCHAKVVENGHIVNVRLGHLRRSIDTLVEARGGVSGYQHPLRSRSVKVLGASREWVA